VVTLDQEAQTVVEDLPGAALATDAKIQEHDVFVLAGFPTAISRYQTSTSSDSCM
jgi:hypothetical protein